MVQTGALGTQGGTVRGRGDAFSWHLVKMLLPLPNDQPAIGAWKAAMAAA